MRRLFSVIGLSATWCLLCVSTFPAFAATALDVPMRFGKYSIDYVLNADATSVETRTWSTTVLKPSAIEWAKHASIGYSTSVQKADILEAYTQKADGRRIDVPKDNYQLNINKGREKDGPVFSDRSSIAVVFPDVAVGDTVVFSYRITQSEAIFPGQFSVNETLSSQYAYDDVRIRIEYPEAMWVQYHARGLQETAPAAPPGRKVVEWSYSNPKPLKSERRDFSVFDPDMETGFSFSTFKSHADIAAAYGVRALPKAAVTDVISKLASEIVGGKNDPREQAKVLYEWVATKITYGGNCVGVGAVVPHDISFILENKMGDCKDHATLLQALLAARGIASMQVLINAGTIYTMPKIPVVSQVNHVINYLPDFDLYLDSTSSATPFGMLPFQDRGKPVLWVDRYKEGARTPTPKLASAQKTISKWAIADDGSLSAEVDVYLNGDAAIGVREWARNLPAEAEADFVKDAFYGMGIEATGSLHKDDPTQLSDSYHYKVKIDKAAKFMSAAGGGAFHLYPIMGGSSVQSMVPSALEQGEPTDFACSNGQITEEYSITLPKKIKLISIPKNLKVESALQSYQAHYAVKDSLLTVKRSFEDRTPTSVCSKEVGVQYAKLGAKVTDNLKQQVLYK